MSDLGKKTEDAVQEICARSFLADFVARSPDFTTEAGHHREAGDLLIHLGKTLIALQVRAKEVDETFDPSDETTRKRVERRIMHAVEQVKTAKRALEGNMLTVLQNLRGVSWPVCAADFETHIGIVVFDLVRPERLTREQELVLSNGYAEVRGIPVHIFFRIDFEALLQELDTIPDLIEYLQVRSQIVGKGKMFSLTRELDLLALVVTDFPTVKKYLSRNLDLFSIEPGLWETYRNRFAKEYETRRLLREGPGQVVDRLIGVVYDTIGYECVDWDGCPARGTVDAYIAIVHEFGKLERVHRIEFGKKVLEKLQRADYDPKGFSYFAYLAVNLETLFVFMASREERNKMGERLKLIASASYVWYNAKRVVGIGTQNRSAVETSFDFLMLENVKFDNEEQLRDFGAKIFQPSDEKTVDEWELIRRAQNQDGEAQ